MMVGDVLAIQPTRQCKIDASGDRVEVFVGECLLTFRVPRSLLGRLGVGGVRLVGGIQCRSIGAQEMRECNKVTGGSFGTT